MLSLVNAPNQQLNKRNVCFQRTRKPYDEKDIMDQFAGGQVEIYGHLKVIEKQ